MSASSVGVARPVPPLITGAKCRIPVHLLCWAHTCVVAHFSYEHHVHNRHNGPMSGGAPIVHHVTLHRVTAGERTCLNEPIHGARRHHSGMRHLLGFMAVLLGVGSFVAAPPSASAAARAGVATGRAVPCAGPTAAPIAHLSVYRGRTLVGRSSVSTGSTFRFRLVPGTYIISNQGHPGRFVGSEPFRVRSGQTTRVVLRNFCM